MGEGLHDRNYGLKEKNAVTVKSWLRKKGTRRINIPTSLSSLFSNFLLIPSIGQLRQKPEDKRRQREGRRQMKRINVKNDSKRKHSVHARHCLKCNIYINLFTLTTVLRYRYFYYHHFTEKDVGTQSAYEPWPEPLSSKWKGNQDQTQAIWLQSTHS